MLRAVRRRCRCDRGMVTAELAASIPVVLLLVGFALAAVEAGRLRLACIDAARDGALAAARGDDADGRAAALRLLPGAEVSVTRSADAVTVTVTAATRAGGLLPGITVSAASTATLEPSGADAAAGAGRPGAAPSPAMAGAP